MPATFPKFAPRNLHQHSLVLDPAGANLDFADAVPSFQLAPQQSVSTWKGGRPTAVYSDISSPVWQATLTLAQDWDNLASFANYLLTNAGKQTAFEWRPGGATGTVKVAGTLILAAPAIGGDIDAWLSAQITCGVVGVPTITGAA